MYEPSSDIDMRCIKCQYSLVGLLEHRCPECGVAFEPDELRAYYCDSAAMRRARRVIASFGMFEVTVVLVCTVIALIARRVYERWLPPPYGNYYSDGMAYSYTLVCGYGPVALAVLVSIGRAVLKVKSLDRATFERYRLPITFGLGFCVTLTAVLVCISASVVSQFD